MSFVLWKQTAWDPENIPRNGMAKMTMEKRYLPEHILMRFRHWMLTETQSELCHL